MGQLRGTGKILRQNDQKNKTKSREKERQKSPVFA